MDSSERCSDRGGRAREVGCVLAGAGCFLVGVAAVVVAAFVCLQVRKAEKAWGATLLGLGSGLGRAPGGGVIAVPPVMSNLIGAIGVAGGSNSVAVGGAGIEGLQGNMPGGDLDLGALQAELGRLLADPAVRSEVEKVMSDDAIMAQMRALLEMGARAASATN